VPISGGRKGQDSCGMMERKGEDAVEDMVS